MKQLDRIQRRAERAAVYVSVITLFALMLLTVAEVVGRYVFNHPVPGSYEFSELAMVPIVFLAAAHVQDLRQHIAVDWLEKYFSREANRFLDLCADVIGGAFFAIMTWQTIVLAWKAWATGDYYMGLLEVPLWPARSLLAIGVGLLTTRLVLCFIKDLKPSVPANT